MTLPPNIRVNVGVPFPALVLGAGPVSLTKANGVWTVGLDFRQLGDGVPGETTVFVFQDTVTGAFFKTTVIGAGGGRTQRSVTTSPTAVLDTDSILNVNSATPVDITLPLASSRAGRALTIKDVGPHASAANITISSSFGELIDGLTTFVINNDRAAVTLVPFNDAVGTGWFVT